MTSPRQSPITWIPKFSWLSVTLNWACIARGMSSFSVTVTVTELFTMRPVMQNRQCTAKTTSLFPGVRKRTVSATHRQISSVTAGTGTAQFTHSGKCRRDVQNGFQQLQLSASAEITSWKATSDATTVRESRRSDLMTYNIRRAYHCRNDIQ